jgi:acetyl esterase
MRFARGLTRLPDSWQHRLSGQPQIVRDGLRLDPQTQLLLALRARLDRRSLAEGSPVEARQLARSDARAATLRRVPVAAVTDLTVDGADGTLAARHYAPLGGTPPRPLLVFYHGGGYVIGDLVTHDQACRLLCRYANIHVLAVDYRLAPEHPFPAAVQDASAALRWAQRHAADLGADPAAVAVGGDSAGGNLATVACLIARDTGAAQPVAQLLIYPAVDANSATASKTLFANGFFLTQADMDWFEGHYGGDTADPYRSPLRANLAGLPPALVVTAGFDPLRDEGEAYAAALTAAGTPATLHRYASLVHGFLNMADVSSSARQAVLATATEFATLLSHQSGAGAATALGGDRP